MKVGIIGCGYVGLTTGICLSSIGHTIHLYDIEQKKLDLIKKKKMPFYELGLEKLLIQNMDKNNFLSEILNDNKKNIKIVEALDNIN